MPPITYYHETEVFAVIILVVGKIVENHATVHLFHVVGILGKVAGQGKEIE